MAMGLLRGRQRAVPDCRPTQGRPTKNLHRADFVTLLRGRAWVTSRAAGRGRAGRNRGAPTPRPVPRARTRAPTSPWHTAASPGPRHWRGRRQLIGRHGRQPTLQLGALHVAHGQHFGEARGRRSIQALLLLVRNKLRRQPDRGEQLGRSQAAATEPRVVHEHKMAQSLHRRPFAADPLVFGTIGQTSEPLERRRPVGPQLPKSLQQVGRIGRADQQPHGMPPVEFGLNVRRHLHTVDHQVAHQPVDDGGPASPPRSDGRRVKSHSRNSASVRSWSSNLAMPGSIHQRSDTRVPGRRGVQSPVFADPLPRISEAMIASEAGHSATRFWRSMVRDAGGTVGVDHSFAERIELGFGAEIMGRASPDAQTGPWTDVGTDDEWRGWWGPNPPFHTPVFVLTHYARVRSRWRAAQCLHFVTPPRRRHSTSPGRPPVTSTCGSAAARRSFANSSPPTSSRPSTSCRCRSCSAAALSLETASKASRNATTSRQSRHRAASPT